MNVENRNWKKAILAASFGIAALVASMTAASAHRSYMQCDRDGDRCWRVICDDDGDDCRQVSMNSDRSYWNGGYYRGDRSYGDRYYNYNYSYNRTYGRRDGRWVCDSDGDRCLWVTNSWPWWNH